MDPTLGLWLSIVVIFLLGTLAHFLYDLLHQPRALGLFTAVNESTWEHIKIALTPTLLWGLYDGYVFGANPNYFCAKLASLLIITFFIPFVFYSYKRLTRHPVLPLDILTFFAAIVLAQFSFYTIITLPPMYYACTYLSAIGCFVFFGAYMTLTLSPLRNQIFRDPTNGQYGYRAHRDFFKSTHRKRKLTKRSKNE